MKFPELFLAFFLGVKRLVEHGSLPLDGKEEVLNSVESFREFFFSLLSGDEIYQQGLLQQVQFWLYQLDDESLLTLPDFYTLPDEINDEILNLKTKVRERYCIMFQAQRR